MRLAAFLLCLAVPAAAQTTDEAATAAANRLQEAAVQLSAAQGRSDRVRALTETVQAYEDGLVAMREGLRQITLQEAILASDLDDRRGEVSRLLGVLSSIGRTPQPVLTSQSDGALNAARAGMMVADVSAGLQAKVVILRDQLDEARYLQSLRQSAMASLSEGWQGAQTARITLGKAISDRTELPLRFEEDPVQTALLVANARNLADFAAQLTFSAPDPDATLEPAGNLPLPVSGIVLPDAGDGRPGIRIATEAQALVRAPAAGTILFQGPLLDYGTVVILEPVADVLFVMAGLDQVFGTPGEILTEGAPIGLMGGTIPPVDGNLTQNVEFEGGQGQQTLYLEVRDGQSPTNPDAWFALE